MRPRARPGDAPWRSPSKQAKRLADEDRALVVNGGLSPTEATAFLLKMARLPWSGAMPEPARAIGRRMSKPTWILVGDGSHARLFEADDAAHPWRLVRRVDREHSREKTDRAGAHEDGGEHDFARHLVAVLETGRERGAFAHLVIVAPPRFLGQLRAELPAPLAALVVRTVDKDYTHESDAVLHERVAIA